ncbi:hypothetical protein WISP_65018 [Willisornis vidua]|uniref:Uncharacterized protein n=1 Tax=Willisornis vidua TaxID=1566151 RepID=A0ABQ9DFA8_9PASS|nr:hypothetical protein WISP_65018 [Willisornis vidua]
MKMQQGMKPGQSPYHYLERFVFDMSCQKIMTSTKVPVGLRQCRTAIKGSPSFCSLFHFSHFFCLKNQEKQLPSLQLAQPISAETSIEESPSLEARGGEENSHLPDSQGEGGTQRIRQDPDILLIPKPTDYPSSLETELLITVM